MKFIHLLLVPFSLLYQGVLRLRNHLYTIGFFGVTEFDIPTINVGNLAFGGTGKTPHIEYLIRLLKPSYQIAVLSRGYKRKTSGYVFSNSEATPFTIGDEPYQIAHKFGDIAVGVCENRVLGLPYLLLDAPETEVVLLDDAYQHRALKPGLNILLTEQGNLYTQDKLVPSGYLREYAAASKRADIIIVTKCNPNLKEVQQKEIIAKLKPETNQEVFFSAIKYGHLVPYFENQLWNEPSAVLAFAGIANTDPFENYLKGQFEKVELKKFPDHHTLSMLEIEQLVSLFETIEGKNKILISTEKDYQKLLQSAPAELLHANPFYYLPIEISFLGNDQERFNKKIRDYVSQNRTNA